MAAMDETLPENTGLKIGILAAALMDACRAAAAEAPIVDEEHNELEAASIAAQALIHAAGPKLGDAAHGFITQTVYQIAMRCVGQGEPMANAWRNNLSAAFVKGWENGSKDESMLTQPGRLNS